MKSGFSLDIVMAGLDPAIHDFLAAITKDVDARHKAGHDEGERTGEFTDFLFRSGSKMPDRKCGQ
jgi:hypothetical protein